MVQEEMLGIAGVVNKNATPFSNLSAGASRESVTPGFFDTPRGQLYYVLHHATSQRRGCILVCGSISVERERSYPTFVKWARQLAMQGYDTLRFDYRGIGESTGRFEDMTMTDWCDDAEFCAAQLVEISQGVPLILHGARAGALIAAKLFASGIGEALLLWAPPISGYALLWDTLRRNLAANMVANPSAPRQTREQLVAMLESGEFVNVDGYFWSNGFWTDAQRHTLVLPTETERRPWHVVHVKNIPKSAIANNVQDREVQISCAPFWESSSLFSPDTDELFHASLNWLDTLVIERGGSV